MHPALKSTSTGVQLIVDGSPFLVLGGQLHNSTPSHRGSVAAAFDQLAAMDVGTVIGSASWSLVEPEEGQFDFSTVTAQVEEATARGLRLVLIWFGAFKNAASTYAPRWVRADADRFPRAVLGVKQALWTYPGQTPKPVLSVFSEELRAADQRAFVAFMAHLAEIDPNHVVIMVQVENEVGVLGDSRDRSPAASVAWASAVPRRLLDHLSGRGEALRPELAALWERRGRRSEGTWSEVFGADWEAEEVFMAWSFARYVEDLAAAGKAAHPLPLFVNAWIGPQPGQPMAGDYPSGGPVGRVLDVWKSGAPSVDLVGPDVYVSDMLPVLADYARDDNPLFVPESRYRTGALFYALGHHHALGFSVFGVEDARPDSQLAQAYGLLAPMTGLITAAQAEGRIAGFVLDDEPRATFALGGFDVTVQASRDLLGRMLLDAGVPAPPPPPARPSEITAVNAPPAPADARPFGLLIDEGDDQFVLVGQGVMIDFAHPVDAVEIDHVEEGRFDADGWRPGRVLNGDERLFLVPMDSLGVVRIRLLRR